MQATFILQNINILLFPRTLSFQIKLIRIKSHTSISSFATTSLGKNATRPSIVIKQSIRAKALQLWTGSGLFIREMSMQEWNTCFSNGSICLTMKLSPNRPPGNWKHKTLTRRTCQFKEILFHNSLNKNTNSNQHVNSITTETFPKALNQRQDCLGQEW